MPKLSCFSSPDVREETLSLKEIERIQSSWLALRDYKAFGLNVMICIFTKYSHLKPMWKFAEPLVTEAEMRSNSQLRFHAHKVANTLNRIIEDLSPKLSDSCCLDLIKLGQTHKIHQVLPEYLSVFQDALLVSLEKTLNNDEKSKQTHFFTKSTKQAWLKLCSILFKYFTRGLASS